MYRKNTASQFFAFQGVSASTGGILSGVTWTIRRCIDGTFAAATGTATEDGTAGWYKFALSQADTNGNDISFNFTGTGAVPQTVNIITTACDPTSTAFGLSIAKTTNITGFNDITAAAAATGVWTDTTAGDFTTALSVGKSVMNGVTLGTGLTVAAVSGAVGSVTGAVGSVTGAVGSVTGAVGSVTGLTASNLDATVSGRMATYTQPTGFLAATFPTGTVANTTNITAGTITTTTNLTNAATVGDFTATMKTSIGTAVAASAVASVTAAVTITGDLSATMKTSVENAVWDATMASHVTAGSTGAALNAAGGAGDPWITALPGAYAAGSAGFIVGNNINATISSRLAAANITLSGGIVSADVKKVNAITVNGSGTSSVPWGP